MRRPDDWTDEQAREGAAEIDKVFEDAGFEFVDEPEGPAEITVFPLRPSVQPDDPPEAA